MTSNEFSPDFFEATVGWRAWIVTESPEGPTLLSMNRTAWTPFERIEAQCRSRHEPPGPGCTCGIYAAATRQQLGVLAYPSYDIDAGRIVVAGEVSLWGGVIPGEQGWRAQFAYPRALLVPYECWQLAVALRERYGVPVRLANTFRLKEL
jgi:hypothetical protein